MSVEPIIAIHGGAGTISEEKLTNVEREMNTTRF